MARKRYPRRTFEEIWVQIQLEITPDDIIRNWTRHSEYLGDEFTIHSVEAFFIEVNAPNAATIQHIAKKEFANVYEHWDDYNSGAILRRELRDITRFSKYVISILHHLLNDV